MSSQKTVVSKKPFCKVCHDCGKSETEYTSHYVRSEPGLKGKIVCPTLLAQECQHCFKKGHTKSHCKEISKLAAKEKYIQSLNQSIIPKKTDKKKNVFENLLDEEEIPVKRNTKNTKTTKTSFKEDFPALSRASVALSVGTTEAQNSKKRSYAFIAKTAHEEAVQEEIIIEYIEKMQPKEIVKPAIVVKPIIKAIPKSWAEYDSEDEEDEEELITATEYYKEYQDRLVKPVVVDAW